MYEFLSRFAQTGGLILFVLAFALVLLYALSPKRRGQFKRAASMPLKDDDLEKQSQADETEDKADQQEASS